MLWRFCTKPFQFIEYLDQRELEKMKRALDDCVVTMFDVFRRCTSFSGFVLQLPKMVDTNHRVGC